jgi:hypothetical protein
MLVLRGLMEKEIGTYYLVATGTHEKVLNMDGFARQKN